MALEKHIPWPKFVDAVTLLWLIVFTLGFLTTNEQLSEICSYVNIGLLPVFVVDVILQYKKSPHWRVFVKEKWLDILMVIPFFRVFRIVRFVRFLRFVRTDRFLKAGNPGLRVLERSWKGLKAMRKGRGLQKRQ